MARPREFDEATALEAAIECFWHRGYEATSVRDLADKMGISGPSLYNAYGDKRALFAQALEHYVDNSARALIKRLEASLPPKQAVRRFIEEIIDRSVNDRERSLFLPINQGGASQRNCPSESCRQRSRALAARRPARHSRSRPIEARTGVTPRRRAPCARASRLNFQQGAVIND